MYHDSPFTRFAKWTSHATGHPATFASAVIIILAWAVTGPIFEFSDTWQLVINTGTTIITFLMVFLIQNTQERFYEISGCPSRLVVSVFIPFLHFFEALTNHNRTHAQTRPALALCHALWLLGRPHPRSPLV